MTEYPFPMNRLSDASLWTIPIHIGLALLAIAPFVFLFFQSRRPASPADAKLLVVSMILAPLFLLVATRNWHESILVFVRGYLIFFEFATLVALAVTIRGLVKQERAKQLVGFFSGLLLLALAIGLLLPAVPSAREAARRMACSNNLKRLIVAVLNYEQDFQYLPQSTFRREGEAPISWRVELLPYLERQHLYADYDHRATWNSVENEPIASTQCISFVCPSNPFPKNETGQYYTAYAMILGPNTPLQENRPVSRSSTNVNSSGAMALAEACGSNIVWTEPRDSKLAADTLGINLPGPEPNTSRGIISSYHTGGAQAAMLDGSVRFFSVEIDPIVLEQLIHDISPGTDIDF